MIYDENTILRIKLMSQVCISKHDHVFFPTEINLFFGKKPELYNKR